MADFYTIVDSHYPNLLGVEYALIPTTDQRELAAECRGLPDGTIVLSDDEEGVVNDGEFVPLSLRELDDYFGEEDASELTPVFDSIGRRAKKCVKGISCGNSCQRKGSTCRKNLSRPQQERYDYLNKAVKQYESKVAKGKQLSDAEQGNYAKISRQKDYLTNKSQMSKEEKAKTRVGRLESTDKLMKQQYKDSTKYRVSGKGGRGDDTRTEMKKMLREMREQYAKDVAEVGVKEAQKRQKQRQKQTREDFKSLF